MKPLWPIVIELFCKTQLPSVMTMRQTTTLFILILLIPAAFAQRMYDSSGRALGRVDAERF
jgi:hypothetical protein